MRVIVSEELIRSFLSYAGEIEVLQPENLRNIMAKRAKSLNQIYN
jgi:predicted DNA-binding transcriptional regulator YafY